MDDRALIQVRDLHLSFHARRRRVDVLKGLSFTIESGERVALVGTSGAGKSSLLYCLAGLLRPSSGTILQDGVDLDGLSEVERARHRLHDVGIVYQAFHLLQGLDALANVALPMRLAGSSSKAAEVRAHDLLAQVGLEDRAHHRPNQLSGGEQQRVAVARAVANGPKVLLADEPTGNLDDESAGEVLALLTGPGLGPTTVVIATHDPRVATLLDRQIRLVNGRLAAQGDGSAAGVA